MSLRKIPGIDIILSIIWPIGRMIRKLDRGVEECRRERWKIRQEIESLKQHDQNIDKAIKRAGSLKEKLQDMIGEGHGS